MYLRGSFLIVLQFIYNFLTMSRTMSLESQGLLPHVDADPLSPCQFIPEEKKAVLICQDCQSHNCESCLSYQAWLNSLPQTPPPSPSNLPVPTLSAKEVCNDFSEALIKSPLLATLPPLPSPASPPVTPPLPRARALTTPPGAPRKRPLAETLIDLTEETTATGDNSPKRLKINNKLQTLPKMGPIQWLNCKNKNYYTPCDKRCADGSRICLLCLNKKMHL